MVAEAFLGSSGCPTCIVMESSFTPGVTSSCLGKPFPSTSFSTNCSRVFYTQGSSSQFLAPNRTLLRSRRRYHQLCIQALQKDPKYVVAPARGSRTSLQNLRQNFAASGISSSKKAWRCLSQVAASLSSMSPEEDSASGSSEGLGAKIDLNLPRRRLQLSFTCDACGARSQRLINPDAYARGTVFVQCAGCEVYHKLVDNLGLIEEYDFRQETNIEGDGADLNEPE